MAKKKIVWVEDDQQVISAYQPLFDNKGWKILAASSAEEGKALIQAENPDLIIMDIIMTDENGYAAIKDLKNELSLANIPIIIYSGVTHRWGETSASRLDALLTEADRFIDKSEKPEVLLNTTSQFLES